MEEKPNDNYLSDDELFCDACGMTYREFLETGVFRCPNCYRVFKYRITEQLKEQMKKRKEIEDENKAKEETPKVIVKKHYSKEEAKKRIVALEKLLVLAKKANDKEKIKVIEEELKKIKGMEIEL